MTREEEIKKAYCAGVMDLYFHFNGGMPKTRPEKNGMATIISLLWQDSDIKKELDSLEQIRVA